MTDTPGDANGQAELVELRADFPDRQIDREHAGEGISYVAQRIRAGVILDTAEAGSASRLRAMLEPPALDTSRPNIARVYDYLLCGKDNYAADRAEAERLLGIYPRLRLLVRQNRLFLGRAVHWLAGHGVRQFIDLGCGLPTAHNTHQAARTASPDCRVVYVDSDPVVVSHARALLSGAGVTAIGGDLADPGAILATPELRRVIDLGEPVAVILAMVLHFFDAATVRRIVAGYAHAVTPGSYVIVSVGSGDQRTGGTLAREYQAGALHNHSAAEIATFFDGLDLIAPGLAEACEWTPGLSARPSSDRGGGHILAGVARKPTTEI